MALYYHDVDELYPVLGLVPLTNRGGAYNDRTAEFTEAEAKRIDAAEKEFWQCQELLNERFYDD
jgi:hypothetical protein